MLKERFEELRHSGKLPSPSGVGLRLLLLTGQEDCSIGAVVEVVRTDPALSGRILRLANSVRNGSSPVATVEEAAVRLGLKAVRNIGLGFSLVSGNRSGRCEEFDYDRYWTWSLANAIAAKRFSEHMMLGDPNELFTCGLLIRIGRLALATAHPEEYAEVLRRIRTAGEAERLSLEKEAFAIHSGEVGACLMEDWGLPEYFGELALVQGDPHAKQVESPLAEEAERIMVLSGQAAQICAGVGKSPGAAWRDLKGNCSDSGIAPEELQDIFERIVEEWQEWGQVLRVPTRRGPRAAELEDTVVETVGPEKADDRPHSPRLRILAVDDEPTSLRILKARLEDAGHLVRTATNGREALEITLEWNPQMVITDWMMPEMDGIELCRRLRGMEAGRDLYILILTGKREEEDRIVEAFEAGADDYVGKSCKPRLLLARTRPGIRVILLQEENKRHLLEKQQKNAKLEIAKRKLKAAAYTDALTDLPNRRYVMKWLEKEWANSSRTGSPLSVIMIDVDHFKSINDRFGHSIGDVVLWSTAQAIHRSLRRGDTCARIGGEEFLVVCPNTDSGGALQLAERIREAVEGNRIERPGFTGGVTVSLGVAERTERTRTIDDLLRVADQSVYQAKGNGRNRVESGRFEMRRSA